MNSPAFSFVSGQIARNAKDDLITARGGLVAIKVQPDRPAAADDASYYNRSPDLPLILRGAVEQGKCRLSAHCGRGLSELGMECNNTHYCARDESSPPQHFHSKASLSASAVCRVCS